MRDDHVDVATVHPLTVELGLTALWDICDHSAPGGGSRGEELQVFTKSHRQMNLIVQTDQLLTLSKRHHSLLATWGQYNNNKQCLKPDLNFTLRKIHLAH